MDKEKSLSKYTTVQAFTVLEVIITILAITVLTSILYWVTNPMQKIHSANNTKDRMVADALERAVNIYITDHENTTGLITKDLNSGFYQICNQGILDCQAHEMHINFDILVTEEYLKFIPKLSTHSDPVSSGYVMHYNKSNDSIVILTYLEWEDLGKP